METVFHSIFNDDHCSSHQELPEHTSSALQSVILPIVPLWIQVWLGIFRDWSVSVDLTLVAIDPGVFQNFEHKLLIVIAIFVDLIDFFLRNSLISYALEELNFFIFVEGQNLIELVDKVLRESNFLVIVEIFLW